MKFVSNLFVLLVAANTAGAFSPLQVRTKTTSPVALQAASSLQNPNVGSGGKRDDWASKPAYKKLSTEPVADKQVGWIERQGMKDVMIEPNFFLTYALALLGPLIIWYHPSYAADGSPSIIGIAGGAFHMLFAALLWVQTSRVRCVFEKDSFEFYNIKGPRLDLEKGAWLERKPDNYVAGTVNRWRYDKIINYGFFPSIDYPVICYFKETETPKEQWTKWFAAFDSYGRGQPHFFPGICNVYQFRDEMQKRGVKRKPLPDLKHRNVKKVVEKN